MVQFICATTWTLRRPLRARPCCRSHSLFPLQRPSQIAYWTNVPQLIRVDDRAHGLDLSASYVERHHTDHLPSAVEEKGAWMTVHLDLMQHRSTELQALACPDQ